MTSKEPLLDEIQWRDSEAVQRFGGIHENTVLYYFHESPFFDKVSNNHSLFTQAVANPALGATLDTREAFESRLNQMSGLEYRVAYGPKDFGAEAYPGSGRWVIRKQNRRKHQGTPDEITVMSTYYVIGENVYMAPSVGDVIWSKMISATQNLNKAFSIASSLLKFTPAVGNVHFDPKLKSNKPPSRRGSEAPSATGSPVLGRSREGTPLPTSQPVATKASTSMQLVNSSIVQSLVESFEIFRRYGKEHVDTHPLAGEPGSFSIGPVKSVASLEPSGIKQLTGQSHDGGTNPNLQSSRPGTPLIKREPSMGGEDSKTDVRQAKQSDQPPKAKRRKSRAPGSPKSPPSTSAQ